VKEKGEKITPGKGKKRGEGLTAMCVWQLQRKRRKSTEKGYNRNRREKKKGGTKLSLGIHGGEDLRQVLR